MIELSMHQLTIQLTIVQRNINFPNHDLARLLQFQAALYLLQITQLVEHTSNQIAITHSINQDSSTNNCAKKYQLTNHDLSSVLQLKQQCIYSK